MGVDLNFAFTPVRVVAKYSFGDVLTKITIKT